MPSWTLTFRAHRNSARLYRLVAEDPASAHFAAAGLKQAGWIVEEVIKSDDTDTETGTVPEM